MKNNGAKKLFKQPDKTVNVINLQDFRKSISMSEGQKDVLADYMWKKLRPVSKNRITDEYIRNIMNMVCDILTIGDVGEKEMLRINIQRVHKIVMHPTHGFPPPS